MIRVSTIFISGCMALLAISIGVILFAAVGLSGAASTVISVAALSFMLLYHIATVRMQGRSNADAHIANLSRGTAELANQFGDLARRMGALETRVEAMETVARTSLTNFGTELQEFGDLLQDLSASVAAHEELIASNAKAVQNAVQPASAAAQAPTVTAPPVAPPAPAIPEATTFTTPVINSLVSTALSDGRVDIHVQPIVSLPQRKVRFYEALCRIRDDNGQTIAASHFINDAARSGQIAKLDQIVILRAMQVLRRLATRSKEVGIFCNISSATLSDPEAFAHCMEFLFENRALASSFVLELRQDTIRKLGQTEAEQLTAIAQLGYRFSVDHVTDLDFEPRALNGLGVRFIKVPADLLLAWQPDNRDIHPADYPKLLARAGITLIAERIENEASVVDLLDYEVTLGQGFLFSTPRALKPEAAAKQPAEAPAASLTAKPATPAKQSKTGSEEITQSDAARLAATLTGNAALVRRVLGTH